MRVVKNKSIPNVDDERLFDSIVQLHAANHTAEGLHAFEGPRRQLVNEGIKGRLITAELQRRGHTGTCTLCGW